MLAQRGLWTEVGLKAVYRKVDAAEARKHWSFGTSTLRSTAHTATIAQRAFDPGISVRNPTLLL